MFGPVIAAPQSFMLENYEQLRMKRIPKKKDIEQLRRQISIRGDLVLGNRVKSLTLRV